MCWRTVRQTSYVAKDGVTASGYSANIIGYWILGAFLGIVLTLKNSNWVKLKVGQTSPMTVRGVNIVCCWLLSDFP